MQNKSHILIDNVITNNIEENSKSQAGILINHIRHTVIIWRTEIGEYIWQFKSNNIMYPSEKLYSLNYWDMLEGNTTTIKKIFQWVATSELDVWYVDLCWRYHIVL